MSIDFFTDTGKQSGSESWLWRKQSIREEKREGLLYVNSALLDSMHSSSCCNLLLLSCLTIIFVVPMFSWNNMSEPIDGVNPILPRPVVPFSVMKYFLVVVFFPFTLWIFFFSNAYERKIKHSNYSEQSKKRSSPLLDLDLVRSSLPAKRECIKQSQRKCKQYNLLWPEANIGWQNHGTRNFVLGL